MTELERAQKLLNGMFSGDAEKCAIYKDEIAQAFADTWQAAVDEVQAQVRTELQAMLDQCSDDFHVCDRCGHQDNKATANSNLFIMLDDAMREGSK